MTERLAHEPEMVRVPAGVFRMGIGERQIDWLAERYDLARVDKTWSGLRFSRREEKPA